MQITIKFDMGEAVDYHWTKTTSGCGTKPIFSGIRKDKEYKDLNINITNIEDEDMINKIKDIIDEDINNEDKLQSIKELFNIQLEDKYKFIDNKCKFLCNDQPQKL